jgi:hypothetical protein
MIILGVLINSVIVLGLLLLIRPCMKLCRRIRLNKTVGTKSREKKASVLMNGGPHGRDSTDSVALSELPEKKS